MKEPNARLRKYQQTAVASLLRYPHGGLFMDPGLGKTLCVLSAFWILRKKKLVKRMLVVAPLRPAYGVWPAEVKKWGFDLKVVILHGNHKERRLQEPADIYVINVDGLAWLVDHPDIMRRLGVDWLVVDESTKVKTPGTIRFKALKGELICFKRRTILSGTPAPKSYLDLWAQVFVADRGARLGAFMTQYKSAYFIATGWNGRQWVLQEGADVKIQDKLKGAFVRFSDEDLGLPPWLPNIVDVQLPTKARKRYEVLEREFILEMKAGMVNAANAGVLTAKLRQVANGAVYDENRKVHLMHDAKLDALEDLTEELQGNPLLVAYEFDHDIKRLLKRFTGAPWIGGGVSPKQGEKIMQEFNQGLHPVLFAQSAALAHGVNLQAVCHQVCWFGLTWNLEDYIQFIKRVHRGGQKKTVTVHHIIAKNTVDERVLAVIGRKDRSQRSLLAALKESYQ